MCSILRKKPCLESEKCLWTVGKGCKKLSGSKESSPVPVKAPTPKEPSPVPVKAPTPPKKKTKVIKKKKEALKEPLPVPVKAPTPKEPSPVPVKAPTPPKKKTKVIKKKKEALKEPSPVPVKAPTPKEPSPVPVKAPTPKEPSPFKIPSPKQTWAPGFYGYKEGDDNFWYAVSYAPNNMSKCQSCQDKILKGELRLSRHQRSPFGDGDQIKNFHAEHAFEEFIKARCTSVPITWDKLNGTKSISDKDRELIYNEIKEFEKAWDNKCKNKKKK